MVSPMPTRAVQGKMTQCEHPIWEPLVAAVGERCAGDFMWMFEVELATGMRLQAYKHVDTRRYLHLGPDGEAFCFVPRESYRRVVLSQLVAEALAVSWEERRILMLRCHDVEGADDADDR